MEIIEARLSSKNQIVIPKAVRERLSLEPQDTVMFVMDRERVFLLPRPVSFTAALQGLFSDIVPEDPDAWLEEERALWEA